LQFFHLLDGLFGFNYCVHQNSGDIANLKKKTKKRKKTKLYRKLNPGALLHFRFFQQLFIILFVAFSDNHPIFLFIPYLIVIQDAFAFTHVITSVGISVHRASASSITPRRKSSTERPGHKVILKPWSLAFFIMSLVVPSSRHPI